MLPVENLNGANSHAAMQTVTTIQGILALNQSLFRLILSLLHASNRGACAVRLSKPVLRLRAADSLARASCVQENTTLLCWVGGAFGSHPPGWRSAMGGNSRPTGPLLVAVLLCTVAIAAVKGHGRNLQAQQALHLPHGFNIPNIFNTCECLLKSYTEGNNNSRCLAPVMQAAISHAAY